MLTGEQGAPQQCLGRQGSALGEGGLETTGGVDAAAICKETRGQGRPGRSPLGPTRPAPAPRVQLTCVAADAGGPAAAPAPARLLARLAGRRQEVLLLAAQSLGRAHEAAQLVGAADAGPEAAALAPGAAGEALRRGRGD